MKKLSIMLSLAIALISYKGNSQNQIKRYDVKSGIVNYKTTITGKVLGSKISGSGEESLYFKNYGSIELKESKSSQTSVMKFFGKEKKETTASHTMSKIENGKTYIVDFENEFISSSNNIGMALMGDKTDAQQTGKDMVIAMGGEKVGDETFKGYNCEVWSLMGAKQWLHKGVMLKLEANTLGISTLTEAVSIKFNVSVPDDKFKLPNFKIQESEIQMDSSEYEEGMEEMDASMEKIEKLSFKEWKEMATKNDPEMKEMSDEELRETYDMIQKMIKMRKGK
jgi:hypothetical protein